nr:MAG TPA: hypothetical protein [Caudoviricetes sp.]
MPTLPYPFMRNFDPLKSPIFEISFYFHIRASNIKASRAQNLSKLLIDKILSLCYDISKERR